MPQDLLDRVAQLSDFAKQLNRGEISKLFLGCLLRRLLTPLFGSLDARFAQGFQYVTH